MKKLDKTRIIFGVCSFAMLLLSIFAYIDHDYYSCVEYLICSIIQSIQFFDCKNVYLPLYCFAIMTAVFILSLFN